MSKDWFQTLGLCLQHVLRFMLSLYLVHAGIVDSLNIDNMILFNHNGNSISTALDIELAIPFLLT